MKELSKEENDLLYEKAKDRMLTWEELYEANKPWHDKVAILKLPYPIDHGGQKWNCLIYMKVVMEKGSAPVIIPMWARSEEDNFILCVPSPKVAEALINEEKEKDEDSAAS